MSAKKNANAFDSAADVLGMGSGLDALFAQSDNPEFMVNLDEIEVVEQVREQMEDDEQDLAGLGDSLVKYQIQAIFLRIMPVGHPKPYRLVAGERRFRAARLKGMTELRAKARELTDEEAEDLQFAENIHRKNLTQIEEAKKIQHDLDRLGSVEAVLEHHGKSRAWLSKILSLLTLPEQAKRLVTENVSADLEVINTVKTIEKADPAAAKQLVDDLKKTAGKSNARDKAALVKEQVKPSSKAKGDKKPAPAAKKTSAKPAGDDAGTVATSKDRSQEEPSNVVVLNPAGASAAWPYPSQGGFADAKTGEDDAADPAGDDSRPAVPLVPAKVLNAAYISIFEKGKEATSVLKAMRAEDKEDVDTWLQSFYDAGKQAKEVGRAVIQGFRNGQFSSDGEGAFALVAFLQGADADAKYSLVNVFGSVKA